MGDLAEPDMSEEETNQSEIQRMDHKREIEKIKSMAEKTNENANHDRWIGSYMDIKAKNIGLRISTSNFQRKLYSSKENIIETINRCDELEINMLLGTEPGQGTNANRTRLKNTLREHGYSAVTMVRDDTTNGGGLVLILSPRWAKVPHKRRIYAPTAREHKGRAMSVVFNNQIEGAHNKIQVIGAHGLNSAETQEEPTIALLKWVAAEKETFERENPLATTVYLGDLNAAINTFLDTDRQEKEGREEDRKEEEKDAFVIKELKKLNLVDIFRGRYPATRAVTRVSPDQTNRFLDRIMVTSEVAAHPATEIAIFKEQFLIAGSDHLMIMADLPIDTAGVADERVAIWQPRTVTKWVRNTDEMGKMDPENEIEFNKRLEEQSRPGEGSNEFAEWVMEAAKGTILKKTTKTYPKKASLKPLYTPDDHLTRANLKTLRYLRQRTESDDDKSRTAIIARSSLPIKVAQKVA